MTSQTHSIHTAQDALALLQWYAEAGVDEAIEDAPVDYFALSAADAKPRPAAAVASSAATQSSPAQAPAASVAPRAATPKPIAKATASMVEEARAAASACTTLAELQAAIEAFDGHPLKKHASNTVFSDGAANAPIMLIGEAPDGDEDRQGIPFCGVNGQLLDKMLAAIDLSREKNAYLCNAVFWRPPGNRIPNTDEIEICKPFIEKHIALINPKVVVLVGNIAAKSLLGATSGITRLRGKAHQYNNDYLNTPIEAYALFHPSYLLSQPAHKALAWKDLLTIKQIIKSKS